MRNKDKRSLIMSLVLGDGCLHYIKSNDKLYGGLTINHGIKQADYQKWKAELLSNLMDRKVKTRTGHRGKSIQLSVCKKNLRSWRRFTYPNGKKSIPKILNFINHPEFALAVWLMDDGYVEYSFTKNKNYSAAFRIFTCDQSEEEQEEIIKWFEKTFDVIPRVRLSKKKDKYYPFIKIKSKDTLKLWGKIREFVLQHKSMQYKFRHVEQIYQSRCL